MAIGIQTPSGFIRLNDKPLDLALTFNSIIDAKKYVAGIDLEHGTPYDGQIIFVKTVWKAGDMYIQFRVTVGDSIRRLDPISVYYYYDFHKSLIQIDASDFDFKDNKLLVFRQVVTSMVGIVEDNSPNGNGELLVCNRENLYSILALLPIYCNNSGSISLSVHIITTDANGAIKEEITNLTNTAGFLNEDITVINPHPAKVNGLTFKKPTLLYDATNNKVLTYDEGYPGAALQPIPYFKNGGRGAYTVEIYVDATDYLTRKDVK